MALKLKDNIYTIANWSVFLLAIIVYALTAQQTVMFWDSGEFIASSHKLQATHPPGAPLYTLISRIFLLLFPTSLKAFAASLFSGVCGAFTVFFLFKIIFWAASNTLKDSSKEVKDLKLPIAAAVIGSVSYLFSDSFWTSSTEAEVYTLSTLFMAIAFWAATKWDHYSTNAYAWRWLLLVVFVLGLSVGVHILNFAILFPIAMLICLRRFKLNIKSVAIGLISALVLFLFLNSILVQGTLSLLSIFEMSAVNSMNLPQHYGTILGIIFLLIVSVSGIIYAYNKKKPLMEFALLAFLCFSIGWSTYAMALIRSDAQTPSSNNAEDVLQLRSYLRSDQFGFSNLPLLRGPSFNSPRDGNNEFIDGPAVFGFDEEKGEYILVNTGKNTVPNYIEKSISLFPRMWNTEAINVNGYKQWIDYTGEPTDINVIINGQRQALRLPTMSENLAFFFNYQVGWLNWRYFLWNFVGRQNNYKGTGHPLYGNWQSGLDWFDHGRIGDKSMRPSNLANHPSSNSFYFLPLLLGLLGIYYLYKEGMSELIVLGLFFLAFSIAITIFINQLPIHIQIRERDYIFLGAYFAFSAFIGMGVLGVFKLLPDKVSLPQKALLSFIICLLLVPASMAIQGWDEHDRSNEIGADVMAKHMLDQCEEQSVLIVSGDNITFPLWYLQEVEEYRTDVRVIDYNLLGLEWYNRRLLKKSNTSEALHLKLSRDFYKKQENNTYRFQKLENLKGSVDVDKLLDYIAKEGKEAKIPTSSFRLNLNKKLRNFDLDYNALNLQAQKNIDWELKKDRYSINDIAMFDLLNQNYSDRPIYFSNTGRSAFGMGLESYFLNHGLVNQLIPAKSLSEQFDMMDIESVHNLVMENYDFSFYSDTTELLHPMHEGFVRSIFIKLHIDLAKHLNLTGDTTRSINVLNHAIESFPNEKISFDYQSIELAKLYLRNGNIVAWRTIIDQTMQNLIETVSWLISFNPQHPIIAYKQTYRLSNSLTLIMNDIALLDPGYERKFVPDMDRLNFAFSDWMNGDPLLMKAQSIQ